MHYAADITRTFPADGKFTEDQKMIYNIVLAAQMNAISAIRPGVSWHNVSKIASMTILNGLLKNGFIKGDLNTLYENKIHQLFMPHSLGHHMGLDVHDAADFATTENILEPNMVITVEPGVYFIGILFDEATEPIKKFLIMDKINKFRYFGGIRIEDDILVTRDGFRVITNVVKTVDGIEKLMQRRK
jgi:Xaa-Pro dipeptidase